MSNREIIELANIIAERPCDSEDCAPCIRMGRRCNDYLKAERAIKAGYRKQNEWISVEERLPDNGETVLTVDNEGYMIVASWYELGGWFCQCAEQTLSPIGCPFPSRPT